MILVLFAATLSAASLLAFFGEWWWVLDLVANLRPQLAVVLSLAALGLWAGRRVRSALAVAVVAGINLAAIVPLYFSPSPGGVVTGERLRVMSFNVNSANTDSQAVIDLIRSEEADLVFLHETTADWEPILVGADLRYQVFRAFDENLVFGTTVLAPEGTQVEGKGFSRREPRAVEVRWQSPAGVEIRLLGIHPLSPDTEERSALRDAQIDYAARWAAEQPGRAIVAGDFNATPWSHTFRHLMAEGELRNSQRGFGLQPSFPATLPTALRLPIDHLLYTDGLRVIDRRLGPPAGSDHYPVVVDLVITS